MTEAASAERVAELLDVAVQALGGTHRPGQVAMAEAVSAALGTGEHLLVQAGTGTGKSLAYLVPAVLHAKHRGNRVVVSTATRALQAQLVRRDLPRLADAVEPLLERRPRFAMLKGRSNYACLHRVRAGVPDESGALVPIDAVAPSGSLGREVVRAREWAEAQAATAGSGDRDDLEPGVSDRAWRQVAVSARECLGAQRCPFGDECFAEEARREAGRVDVVVTNHALLAIDAFEGVPVLPEHAAVIVDEAHELAARVTAVATGELSAAAVTRAAQRVRAWVEDSDADELANAAESLGFALRGAAAGRVDTLPEPLADAVAGVRDAARATQSGFVRGASAEEPDREAVRRQARAALDEVYDIASRVAAGGEDDVVWVEGTEGGTPVLRVAPLSVAALLGERLFGRTTSVLTSATLQLGGSFDAVAGALGLLEGDPGPTWRGVDVGSPFDYARQAILYVAGHLPAPGRDGLSEPALDELAALVEAAGGRTLGLFSSRRAAEQAAVAVRERLPAVPVLLQGEDQVPALVRRFAGEAATCLFGTLSLWQGVDVPGSACQLVVMDRLPFPRPDDPLMSARQRAVAAAGGNGFMTVAAAHAALLLAQGSGRLIRRASDRGMVAVLDPRLVTARYGPYLMASLPPMWRTVSREAALAALRRIDAAARPVEPVGEVLRRSVG